MTPEGKVKARVKRILESLGCYYFMPVGGGFGRAGVPDFIGCLNGCFFGIETKANGGKATALQKREMERVTAAGGCAMVIDENNIDGLEEALRGWANGRCNSGL